MLLLLLVKQPRRFGSAGKRLEMGVEPGTAVVGVHVESILGEAGNVRAEELAAEGEDEPIIGKKLVARLRFSLRRSVLPRRCR